MSCTHDTPLIAQRESLHTTLLIFAFWFECAPSGIAAPLNESVWTTEKEINVFLNNGWASEITQTIQGTTLQNNIPFVRNRGFFAVGGSLATPDPRGIRTEFIFETATLQLGPVGPLTLPPVGQGWFDTVYLDDNLRIDSNSRSDILICEPFPDS